MKKIKTVQKTDTERQTERQTGKLGDPPHLGRPETEPKLLVSSTDKDPFRGWPEITFNKCSFL